ncbi:MAG: cytochrome c, partial [Candidatus Marinimicrobia bacterium]|nr:cytochrome c [Candidatus Neomarinimicrobiota bacterium]
MKLILLIPLIIFMTGCNPDDKDNSSDSAVLTGEAIYNKNCLGCHGPNGQGLAKDWKVKDENGNYPAPPLNGTAHTWHHSPAQLLYTINKGGVEMG